MCVPIFCKKFSVGREFSLTNAKYYTTEILKFQKGLELQYSLYYNK